jgi:GNAT superfamily N-acetyltransferase
VLIREAKLSDAAKIARVNVDTWKSTYQGILPPPQLALVTFPDRKHYAREIIQSADKDIVVAEIESGKIVGFAAFGPERAGGLPFKGELYVIYVLKSFQRKGIGSRLLAAVRKKLLEKGIHSFMVWALHDNPYQRFYQTLGGAIVYTRTLDIEGFKTLERAYGWWDITTMFQENQYRNHML